MRIDITPVGEEIHALSEDLRRLEEERDAIGERIQNAVADHQKAVAAALTTLKAWRLRLTLLDGQVLEGYVRHGTLAGWISSTPHVGRRDSAKGLRFEHCAIVGIETLERAPAE